jgi:hypothetical protein
MLTEHYAQGHCLRKGVIIIHDWCCPVLGISAYMPCLVPRVYTHLRLSLSVVAKKKITWYTQFARSRQEILLHTKKTSSFYKAAMTARACATSTVGIAKFPSPGHIFHVAAAARRLRGLVGGSITAPHNIHGCGAEWSTTIVKSSELSELTRCLMLETGSRRESIQTGTG